MSVEKLYPIKLICETVSDCEWVYHNYQDLLGTTDHKRNLLPSLFECVEKRVMNGKKTQIVINSKKQISWCEACEDEKCIYIKSRYYCQEEKKLPPIIVKVLRREEKLRRILK